MTCATTMQSVAMRWGHHPLAGESGADDLRKLNVASASRRLLKSLYTTLGAIQRGKLNVASASRRLLKSLYTTLGAIQRGKLNVASASIRR